MILSRIFQGFRYIFCRYNDKNNVEVRKILNLEEFEIFEKMDDYDKVHSFRLYKMVSEDEILKHHMIYKKLALLHDCGKANMSLFKRVKKVILKDKTKENHPELSYEKLKNINEELASLARKHHNSKVCDLMKRFQILDDK